MHQKLQIQKNRKYIDLLWRRYNLWQTGSGMMFLFRHHNWLVSLHLLVYSIGQPCIIVSCFDGYLHNNPSFKLLYRRGNYNGLDGFSDSDWGNRVTLVYNRTLRTVGTRRQIYRVVAAKNEKDDCSVNCCGSRILFRIRNCSQDHQVPTGEQLADIFTKASPFFLFERRPIGLIGGDLKQRELEPLEGEKDIAAKVVWELR
jgi:hypothetical protein